MEKQFGNIFYKRFFYFNLYIIKGRDGDILIDTGFLFQRRKIKKWLDMFNIKLIILTHAHIDHIWNTAYFKKLYNCEVAISKDDIKYLDNRLIHSKAMYKFFIPCTFIMNLVMKCLRQKRFSVDVKLKDKQVLEKFGNRIKIISLPGHTKGTIGLLYEDVLICGDAIVNRGKFVQPAYQNVNNKEAIKSVLKLIDLNPRLVLVGHDKPVSSEKLVLSKDSILLKEESLKKN